MNKTNISGWKEVLSFTFIQTMKSKAFIISFIIFILLAAASIPITSVLTKGNTNNPDEVSQVQKVYVNNQSNITILDFSGIYKERAFSQITFETMNEDYDKVSDRIENGETASVILSIAASNNMYTLSFAKASKGPIGDSDLTQLGDAVSKQFNICKISSQGITADQKAMLDASVDTTVSFLDVNGNPIVKKDTSISGAEYWFIYGLLFVVLMVNSFASGQIASAIVTEKSSRVMEYLLTSVKPLALIIGKVIATLAAVLIEMVTLVVMVFISNQVSTTFITGKADSVLSKYLPSNIFANLNIINIIICILFILAGLIFYATLAGLAGATVSKIEDLREGLTLFTFTNIIGAYVGLAAMLTLQGSGTNGFVNFAFIFPLSSPFLIPGALLVGRVSLPIAAASFVALIISVILLFKFVAKVFEMLILHTGNTIKVKELFKLSKI